MDNIQWIYMIQNQASWVNPRLIKKFSRFQFVNYHPGISVDCCYYRSSNQPPNEAISLNLLAEIKQSSITPIIAAQSNCTQYSNDQLSNSIQTN